LNAKNNTEAHLISVRYEIVAVKNAGLPLRGEQAELNTALIASIKEQKQNVEKGIKNWMKASRSSTLYTVVLPQKQTLLRLRD